MKIIPIMFQNWDIFLPLVTKTVWQWTHFKIELGGIPVHTEYVFIFLTIWIFKIPQYRCHLNNVWNATLLERGLFSLLHFGEDTAVCVTKRESSETEALVECEEREDVIHNIHIDHHKYPPSAASAPASLTN